MKSPLTGTGKDAVVLAPNAGGIAKVFKLQLDDSNVWAASRRFFDRSPCLGQVVRVPRDGGAQKVIGRRGCVDDLFVNATAAKAGAPQAMILLWVHFPGGTLGSEVVAFSDKTGARTVVAHAAVGGLAYTTNDFYFEPWIDALGARAHSSPKVKWAERTNTKTLVTHDPKSKPRATPERSMGQFAHPETGVMALDKTHLWYLMRSIGGDSVFARLSLADPTDNEVVGYAGNADDSGRTYIGEDDLQLSDEHVFWARPHFGDITYARKDGTCVGATLVTKREAPSQLAVIGQHVYWLETARKPAAIFRVALP